MRIYRGIYAAANRTRILFYVYIYISHPRSNIPILCTYYRVFGIYVAVSERMCFAIVRGASRAREFVD